MRRCCRPATPRAAQACSIGKCGGEQLSAGALAAGAWCAWQAPPPRRGVAAGKPSEKPPCPALSALRRHPAAGNVSAAELAANAGRSRGGAGQGTGGGGYQSRAPPADAGARAKAGRCLCVSMFVCMYVYMSVRMAAGLHRLRRIGLCATLVLSLKNTAMRGCTRYLWGAISGPKSHLYNN